MSNSNEFTGFRVAGKELYLVWLKITFLFTFSSNQGNRGLPLTLCRLSRPGNARISLSPNGLSMSRDK